MLDDMDIDDADLFGEDPGFEFDFGVGQSGGAVDEADEAVEESFAEFSDMGESMDFDPASEVGSLESGMEADPGEEMMGDEAADISDNREAHFSPASGRFHDPEDGEFEPGSPPSDHDAEVDRFRGENGQFKDRADDLYDEEAEVEHDDLSYEG